MLDGTIFKDDFLRNCCQFSLTCVNLQHCCQCLLLYLVPLNLAHFANEIKKITRQPLFALRIFEAGSKTRNASLMPKIGCEGPVKQDNFPRNDR